MTHSTAAYDRYVKVVEAEFPRMTINSTIPTGISLAVVFDHYRIKKDWKSSHRKPVNLYFMSGTGMTKAIWQYHIKRLFQYSEDNESLPRQLNNAIAIDLVNHGESAVENTGRLGFVIDWREGAHDLIQVAKSLRLQGTNIVVGHSMGGFQALYASSLAPLLFQHVIAIEPVIYGNPGPDPSFYRRMAGLDRKMKSEFNNEEEFDYYFKNKSIFKNFHDEILRDYMESEKIVHRDGRVSAKTTKEQQLICYMNAGPGVRLWKEILSNVSVPVIHAIGKSATWTPPDSISEIRKQLKKVKPIDIEGGLHLVNCEKPETIIEIIVDCLNNNINESVDLDVSQGKTYEEIFNENYFKLYKSKL